MVKVLKDIRFVLACMVFEAVDWLHSALEAKIDSWCEEDTWTR
ncbi:hypothetical protein SEND513_93 [Mycobacterium phage Send513]|uniref:Uncharacterized protein n=2 Tax=Papyrusvirus send513 TaxID=1982556 RepID=G1BRS1_9CAUD|nr:hypothetical protein FDI62_gp93 [Mycobacterium phage Send513]AEK07537.1 hypothetical protein SEND513_93 [Mycobacterium phage Send513]AYQ98667.1 hypothetical protein SEA_RIPARIAN_96 [Mycobacterium phage Riparian]